MKNNFMNIILDFMKDAGEIALEYQNNLSANIKKDLSIVTEADLTISKMFHKKIENFLELQNHKILDEENLPNINNLFNSDTEYLWTIDPIDGTTTYFYGFPLWAIGISLYKNFKPYIGAIYMPKTGELIYTDSKKSYFIKNAFTKNEIIIELKNNKKELTKKSIILQHKLKNYDETQFTILDLYSAYVSSFYTLTNNGIGTFVNKPMKLWDITATLPIAINLGMCFKNIENDKDILELNKDIIDENWYLKDTYLLCNKQNYDDIKKIIKKQNY